MFCFCEVQVAAEEGARASAEDEEVFVGTVSERCVAPSQNNPSISWGTTFASFEKYVKAFHGSHDGLLSA